jgi:hypothetical protein
MHLRHYYRPRTEIVIMEQKMGQKHGRQEEVTNSRHCVLLGKLIVAQPMKESLACYGARRFNTAFTRAHAWSAARITPYASYHIFKT